MTKFAKTDKVSQGQHIGNEVKGNIHKTDKGVGYYVSLDAPTAAEVFCAKCHRETIVMPLKDVEIMTPDMVICDVCMKEKEGDMEKKEVVKRDDGDDVIRYEQSSKVGIQVIMESPEKAVRIMDDIKKNFLNLLVRNKEVIKIKGRNYVKAEGWQTLGVTLGVTSRIMWTKEIRDNGAFLGFEARAEAVCKDKIIGAGEAECTREEELWFERPRFALKAMAQTRAGTRSLKQVLSGVIAHLGFEVTPAEEMDGITPRIDTPPVDTPIPDDILFKKIGFGKKHKGETWGQVEIGYLEWLAKQKDTKTGKSSANSLKAQKVLELRSIAVEDTPSPATAKEDAEGFEKRVKEISAMKDLVGESKYREVLKRGGMKHANDFKTFPQADNVLSWLEEIVQDTQQGVR